jgi:hypothetical protein
MLPFTSMNWQSTALLDPISMPMPPSTSQDRVPSLIPAFAGIAIAAKKAAVTLAKIAFFIGILLVYCSTVEATASTCISRLYVCITLTANLKPTGIVAHFFSMKVRYSSASSKICLRVGNAGNSVLWCMRFFSIATLRAA